MRSKKNILIFASIGSIIAVILCMLIAVLMVFPKRFPAFPTAEGFAAYTTTGGRQGKVYHIKTLEDNNEEGSLRHALNQKGPRTIVFDVDGVISLKSPLIINNGDLTIAGQTAPKDGICLKDNHVVINADNIIIRYIRIRPGENTQEPALLAKNRKNIIIDHCSFSWSVNDIVSLYDNANLTLQWSIISESINSLANISEGKGASLGGYGISIHHNLFANNSEHNPLFMQGHYKSDNEIEHVDFRNNVISNWASNSAQGLFRGRNNIVNNFFQAGPATKMNVCSQFVEISYKNAPKNIKQKVNPILYITGNINNINPIHTIDNRMGVIPNNAYILTGKNALISPYQFFHEPISMQSAQKAYEQVLKYAGASKYRDTVDKRLITEVETGIYKRANSIRGILFNTAGEDLKYDKGIPSVDSDNDGMPDEWEIKNGLNPYNSSDGSIINPQTGYTNLEQYLNSLTANIDKEQSRHQTISMDWFLLQCQKLANLIKR